MLPNPLVRELTALSREAGTDLPWVGELAADIFMGRFSPKFLRAAHLAGELLTGTLYARYYDIDYSALPGDSGERRSGSAAFDALCQSRAGVSGKPLSVAANGTVIEQAQSLTTHNLATLVHAVGVSPAGGWTEVARRTFATVLRLAGRIERNPRPLPAIKGTAYARRHPVFFLSMPDVGDPRRLIDEFHADLADAPVGIRTSVEPALVGLGYLAAGGRFTDGHAPAGGRRLLGWNAGRHWMLPSAVRGQRGYGIGHPARSRRVMTWLRERCDGTLARPGPWRSATTQWQRNRGLQ
ncbi:MAG TPA: hypothetical protein VF657_18980 [Actinoplanes sp.]